MIKEVLLAALSTSTKITPLPTLFMIKKNGPKCENGKANANFIL